MTLSSSLIHLLFLALPGVVTWRIYRKLKGSTSQKDWEDIFEIAFYSLLCYSILGLIFQLITLSTGTPYVVKALEGVFDEKVPIFWGEIISASLIGVILAFLGSLLHSHKMINKIGKFCRVTKRWGDDDVWELFHNRSDPTYVVVRDHLYDLVYTGWTKYFSDPGKPKELLLMNVKVFRNTEPAGLLYTCDSIYLARDSKDLTIEVPSIPVPVSPG